MEGLGGAMAAFDLPGGFTATVTVSVTGPVEAAVVCELCGYRGEQIEPYPHAAVCTTCRHADSHVGSFCRECHAGFALHTFELCNNSRKPPTS